MTNLIWLCIFVTHVPGEIGISRIHSMTRSGISLVFSPKGQAFVPLSAIPRIHVRETEPALLADQPQLCSSAHAMTSPYGCQSLSRCTEKIVRTVVIFFNRQFHKLISFPLYSSNSRKQNHLHVTVAIENEISLLRIIVACVPSTLT